MKTTVYVIVDSDNQPIKAKPGDQVPMSFHSEAEAEDNRLAGVAAGYYAPDNNAGIPQCRVEPLLSEELTRDQAKKVIETIPLTTPAKSKFITSNESEFIGFDVISFSSSTGMMSFNYIGTEYATLDINDKLTINDLSDKKLQYWMEHAINNRITELKREYTLYINDLSNKRLKK